MRWLIAAMLVARPFLVGCDPSCAGVSVQFDGSISVRDDAGSMIGMQGGSDAGIGAPPDAGAPDAGAPLMDSGTALLDAGQPDAGQPDAGTLDAGQPDAGFDAGFATVLVQQLGTQVDPTNTLPIGFLIQFSKPLLAASFTSSDITQLGTATGVTWSVMNMGDNRNFTVTATATASFGTIRPSLTAGTVIDVDGNPNLSSSSGGDDTVSYIGLAVLTISPSSATSTGVSLGEGTHHTFVVSNHDAGTATLPAFSDLSNGLAVPYTLGSGTCLATATLGPNQSCSVTVVYAPDTLGPHNDSLDIAYGNGMGTVLTSATLAGSAVAPKKIFRSVGPGNSAALSSSLSIGTVRVSASVAHFTQPLPLRVGVGDALVYNGNVAFFSYRVDDRTFILKTALGAAAPDDLGTTWSLYRAYTSLNAVNTGSENPAITALDPDTFTNGRSLTANNEQWNIACYGDAPDSAASMRSTWATSATRNLVIFTPYRPTEVGISQRHDGYWSDAVGKYRIEAGPLGTPSGVVQINTRFAVVDGLQIRRVTTANEDEYGIHINNAIGGDLTIRNNLLRGNPANTFQFHTAVIPWGGGAGVLRIYNNVMFNWPNGGGVAFCRSDFAYVYNNTAYNIGSGFFDDCGGGGVKTVTNNISQRSATSGYSPSWTAASGNNLSDLNDAPGLNPMNSIVLEFVDAGGFDFHLSPSDLAAIGTGVPLDTDFDSPFSTDFDGQTRTTPWCVGADER